MGYYLKNPMTEPVPETRPASRLSRAVAKNLIGAPFCRAILSTKYWDQDTKMAYYGYRYYSPSMGRWLSRDPLHEHFGANRYGFAKNCSVVYVDFLGLCVPFTTKCENKTFDPPKKSVPWEYVTVTFSDRVQGDGGGAGVGGWLSYVCHYKRKLHSICDHFRCNLFFRWCFDGKRKNVEEETIETKHSPGTDFILGDAGDYIQYGTVCRGMRPAQ